MRTCDGLVQCCHVPQEFSQVRSSNLSSAFWGAFAAFMDVQVLGTVTGGYISESHSLQRQVLGSVGQSHKRNSNSHGCSGHFWPIEFEGTECVQALCFGNEHASQIWSLRPLSLALNRTLVLKLGCVCLTEAVPHSSKREPCKKGWNLSLTWGFAFAHTALVLTYARPAHLDKTGQKIITLQKKLSNCLCYVLGRSWVLSGQRAVSRYPIFLDSLVMRLRTHQTYPRMPRMPCAAPLGCMDLSTVQTDLQCTVLTQHEEFLAAGKYLCRIRHLESWWCRIGFGLIMFDPPIPLILTTLMASCSTSHFPGDVLREIVVLPCSPPVWFASGWKSRLSPWRSTQCLFLGSRTRHRR